MDQFKQAIEVLHNWKEISEEERINSCNKIIEIAQKWGLSLENIKELAICLAKSGSIWQWSEEINPIIDICSTGGAGSLTTLLCPYFISSQGIFASQVSVPGSIAGAIDTLGILPDYKFQLNQIEMESALETSGIGYTLNTSDLAPADLFLFNLRKNKNAKELPDLVIASLLSKKICSGVNNVIVDVRMGPTGNFGYTLADVERNSRKMVSAGQSLGIKCICILTNNNYSAIPHYGRLESLSVAWDLANKKPLDAWTNEHIETCIKIAAYGICAFKHIGFKEAIQFIEESIKNGSMLNKLELNLRSQGSSVESIRKLIGGYEFKKKYPIISSSNGYVKSININKIRDIFLEVYKNNYDQKRFNSPIGFSFHLREGMRVREGDVLMEVRTPPEGINNYICKINSIVNIQDEPFYACLNERICGVIKYE